MKFGDRFAETIAPYRISSHWWYRWQSEYPALCRFARRGRTARAAERRMRRDVSVAVSHPTRRAWGQWWRELLAEWKSATS